MMLMVATYLLSEILQFPNASFYGVVVAPTRKDKALREGDPDRGYHFPSNCHVSCIGYNFKNFRKCLSLVLIKKKKKQSSHSTFGSLTPSLKVQNQKSSFIMGYDQDCSRIGSINQHKVPKGLLYFQEFLGRDLNPNLMVSSI